MSIHSPHADLYENGLDAACPRCAEHIADPLAGLDDPVLHRLYAGDYLSDGDRMAGENLHTRLRQARNLLNRFGELDRDARR